MYIYSFGGENMKKIFKNLTIAAVAVASLVTLTPNDKAEAATTGWQTLWGNCQVRIWVDAYTYTKGATTIDTWAEQNGACGRLDYEAYLRVGEGHFTESQVTGSFTGRSNTKSLYLRPIRNAGLNSGSSARVEYNFYNGNFAQSHNITVY